MAEGADAEGSGKIVGILVDPQETRPSAQDLRKSRRALGAPLVPRRLETLDTVPKMLLQARE